MDEELPQSGIHIQKQKLYIFIAFLGIFLIVVFFRVFSFLTSNRGEEVKFVAASSSAQLISEIKEFKVDISGAVKYPAVYAVKMDARVADAIAQAGGFSSTADFNWIAQNLNQAAKIADGLKIYIPQKGEVKLPLQGQSGVVTTAVLGTSANENKLINVNTAAKAELDTLAGVGEVTAQKIIDNRPFNSIQELLTKKVMNKSTFEKIKSKIVI